MISKAQYLYATKNDKGIFENIRKSYIMTKFLSNGSEKIYKLKCKIHTIEDVLVKDLSYRAFYDRGREHLGEIFYFNGRNSKQYFPIRNFVFPGMISSAYEFVFIDIKDVTYNNEINFSFVMNTLVSNMFGSIFNDIPSNEICKEFDNDGVIDRDYERN